MSKYRKDWNVLDKEILILKWFDVICVVDIFVVGCVCELRK